METVVVWLLLGLTTGKFDEDLDVSRHLDKQSCIEAAMKANWEDWSCVPTVMPKGDEFVIVTKNGRYPATCIKKGGFLQGDSYERCEEQPAPYIEETLE